MLYKDKESIGEFMKYICFLILGACLFACNVKVDMSKVPPGAIRCGSNWDCPSHMYCGFYGVDTPPVCKPKY